jgi:hypothetical protein
VRAVRVFLFASVCILLTGCEPAVLHDRDLQAELAIDQFKDDLICSKAARPTSPEYTHCMQALERQEIGK